MHLITRYGLASVAAAGVTLATLGCGRTESRASANASSSVDWPSYAGSLDGHRYVPLDQVNRSNVSRLKPVWELRLGEEGPYQAGPIVIRDTMILTTAHTTVAMNAITGAVFWRQVDSSGKQDPISVNRGAAYLDGRVFRGGSRPRCMMASTTT